MTTTHKSAELLGRILIAAMFIDAGVPKISAFAATQAYMASAGVPGALLPAVIALEVLGGVALILGYRTRIVAMAMAAFTVFAALLFHGAPDQIQRPPAFGIPDDTGLRLQRRTVNRTANSQL